ncbi:MAG: M20/M25/M40 family metallo-hydrolase [Clostridiales bacterium]|nr:M20/M25/M40 family metallo-hydrolase [Candidatus Equinaster intestinalis]
MELKELLFTLSNAVSIGYIDEAVKLTEDFLGEFCDVSRRGKTLIGKLGKNKDYTILIEAHTDEVGMVVTDIDDNGFLTASKCGGIDLRHLSAKPVTIHGKEKYTGVFVSTPPHLKNADEVPESISEIKIDSLLGKTAKEKISIGDFVTYSTRAFSLGENSAAGKSFDNRIGVACIIELAKRLYNADIPCNVIFLLCDAEELGLRGAKTAAFSVECDEAVAIDVSFGDGPDIDRTHCGKSGGGAMIGVSPCLDRAISDKLCRVAEKYGITCQREIMSGTTSTDADVISVTKEGIRTGLISVPIRNMHTDTETVFLSDIYSTCDILEKYILSGGSRNV